MSRFVLASASPRRAEILDAVGADYIKCPVQCDETLDPSLPLEVAAAQVAARKALAAVPLCKEGIIIGADTVVSLEGEVFLKPANSQDATQMLSRLAGRTHLVITGFACLDAATGRLTAKSHSTRVTFKPLNPDEIENYVRNNQTADKAGGYNINGAAALFIEEINGDFYSVMGLPISKINDVLIEDFGTSLIYTP